MIVEDLRRVGSRMLDPLMREEAEAWQEVLGWNYSATQRFLSGFIDRGALPGFVLLENGRPLGYTYLVLDGDKGVIGALYVARSRWGEGLESRLASAAIGALRETPVVARIESQLILFSGADITPVFREAGFESFRRHFLSLELASWQGPDATPEGLELRDWGDSLLEEASRVVFESYIGGIDAYFSSSFSRPDKCRGFIINIVRHSGCGIFLPRMTTAGFEGGRMVGAVIATELSHGVGHLPQISVIPEAQGRRIGAWLVGESLKRYREAGYHAVSLTVTERNERAHSWYQRLGFSEVLPFDAYLWTRKSPGG